jgi:hypothetical protein
VVRIFRKSGIQNGVLQCLSPAVSVFFYQSKKWRILHVNYDRFLRLFAFSFAGKCMFLRFALGRFGFFQGDSRGTPKENVFVEVEHINKNHSHSREGVFQRTNIRF